MKANSIVDVAELAGVSTSTVSRYFNDGNVGLDLKKKIDKVVEKTGYQPNINARALGRLNGKRNS
jgi:LacI family sucrose operon transcriptional repressor